RIIGVKLVSMIQSSSSIKPSTSPVHLFAHFPLPFQGVLRPFPPESPLSPRTKGQESKKTLRVLGTLQSVLHSTVRRSIFWAAAGERSCRSLALFHPSRDFRASWHQVLWV